MTTQQELIKKHKKLTSHFLLTNYPMFFDKYNAILIESDSYVTKRQSIKLLSEILLERANYTLMTTYIKSDPYLRSSMRLLRDQRRMIQYEAFHIFKIFVANPHKSDETKRTLYSNRQKILDFLPDFLEDRQDDLQFKDEKAYCIVEIEKWPIVGLGARGMASKGTGTTATTGVNGVSGVGGGAGGVNGTDPAGPLNGQRENAVSGVATR